MSWFNSSVLNLSFLTFIRLSSNVSGFSTLWVQHSIHLCRATKFLLFYLIVKKKKKFFQYFMSEILTPSALYTYSVYIASHLYSYCISLSILLSLPACACLLSMFLLSFSLCSPFRSFNFSLYHSVLHSFCSFIFSHSLCSPSILSLTPPYILSLSR